MLDSPYRAPEQDFHLRSQRPCQAHLRSPLGARCAANPRALPQRCPPPTLPSSVRTLSYRCHSQLKACPRNGGRSSSSCAGTSSGRRACRLPQRLGTRTDGTRRPTGRRLHGQRARHPQLRCRPPRDCLSRRTASGSELALDRRPREPRVFRETALVRAEVGSRCADADQLSPVRGQQP